MRIGLDGIPLTEPKAGIGHYTAELAAALARQSPSDDFELILPDTLELPAGVEAAYAARERTRSPENLRIVRASSSGVRLRWWSMGLPLVARERGLALFHGTNFHIPVWDTCPAVLTVHDLSSLRFPDTHREALVSRARRRLRPMTRAATLVITPTEAVRREACELLDLPPRRVVAVHEAPRASFLPLAREEAARRIKRLGVEGDFLLAVGTIEPRKNLSTLVRACAELQRAGARVPRLVVAGGRGWLSDDLHALVRGEGLAGRTLFTGYVGDEDLRALYSACALAVYPSLYEGFGLPPLEAMACGAAVIASRIPALEETCGGAARLVDPLDHAGLARAIAELLSDASAREQLSRAGRERAVQFTWERAAQRTREVYEEAIALWRFRRGGASTTASTHADEETRAGVSAQEAEAEEPR